MRFWFTAILHPSIRQDADHAHSCSAKNGSTLPLSRSAAVRGVLVVYSLAAAHLDDTKS